MESGASFPESTAAANQEVRSAWNANAAFWDERMADGNAFFHSLIWPATARLLGEVRGRRVLDIACGNGVAARRLAEMGACVLAFDFAEELVRLAQERSADGRQEIDYRVLDATDEAALLTLGEKTFDAAVCCMALFDMAEIRPLLLALHRLLVPTGSLVFSVLHPCFNNAGISQMAEMVEREGELTTQYSVKIWRYLSSETFRGIAMVGEPTLQPIFHRPLGELFGAFFEAGFVLDGLEERAFPPGDPAGTFPLSWSGNFCEIPPVLVARVVPIAAREAN